MLYLLLVACMTEPGDDPEVSAEVVVSDSSFGCITDMTPVRAFYVDNLLGDVASTLAAAEQPEGADWPAGSVVQLIPTEVMVKREEGFSPSSHDWEFFALRFEGETATIAERGVEEVENAFGGNCFSCHVAAVDYDLICERDHGCVALPFDDAAIRSIQEADQRCGG